MYWLGCTGDWHEVQFLAYDRYANTWRKLGPPPLAICSGEVLNGRLDEFEIEASLEVYNFYVAADNTDGTNKVYVLWRNNLAVRAVPLSARALHHRPPPDVAPLPSHPP